MNRDELIRDNIQPVILGYSKKARKTARELFLQYKIVSYICDTKSPSLLRSLFCVSSVFIKLPSGTNSDVLCDSLFRLAASDSSCVWILSSCKESYSMLAKEKKDTLESVFIISEPDAISSAHPLLRAAQPKQKMKL